MPINRGPFNALVDDDGSGNVGSVWEKAAIANVILDPIDANVAFKDAANSFSVDQTIQTAAIFGTSGPVKVAAGGGNVLQVGSTLGPNTVFRIATSYGASAYSDLQRDSGYLYIQNFGAASGIAIYGGANATVGLLMGGKSANDWTIDTAGHHYPFTNDNALDLGTSAKRVRNLFLGTAALIGSNPAQSGGIRLGNSQQINWRNNANTADIVGLYVDVNDRLIVNPVVNFAAGLISTPTNTNDFGSPSAQIRTLYAGSSVWVGRTVGGGALVFGTTPATTGTIRLENNTSITARNGANGADINLIRLDTTDNIFVGTNGATAGVYLYGTSLSMYGTLTMMTTTADVDLRRADATKSLRLCGGNGGSQALGAWLELFGNSSVFPGKARLQLGNIAGSAFEVWRNDAAIAFKVDGATGTISGADASGLANLNGTNVTSGTIADARLSSNVVLENIQNYFTAYQTITVPNTQALFAGTGSGGILLSKTDGATDAKQFGIYDLGTSLRISAYSDAGLSQNNGFSMDRSGNVTIVGTFTSTNPLASTFSGSIVLSGGGGNPLLSLGGTAATNPALRWSSGWLEVVGANNAVWIPIKANYFVAISTGNSFPDLSVTGSASFSAGFTAYGSNHYLNGSNPRFHIRNSTDAAGSQTWTLLNYTGALRFSATSDDAGQNWYDKEVLRLDRSGVVTVVTSHFVMGTNSLIARNANDGYLTLAGGSALDPNAGAFMHLIGTGYATEKGTIRMVMGNDSGARIRMNNASGTTIFDVVNNGNIHTYGPIYFGAGGISSSWYLSGHTTYGLYTNTGIWVSSPAWMADKLQVKGAIYPGRQDNGDWQYGWAIQSHPSYGIYFNTGLYCQYYIWAGGGTGNMYCGMVGGATWLDLSATYVKSQAMWAGTVSGNATYLWVRDDGYLAAWRGLARRNMTDVEPLTDWSSLLTLRPVSFQPIDDGPPYEDGRIVVPRRTFGFVAEDIERDEARAFGGPDTVHLDRLTAPLVAAIQNLHARLAALEAKIAA